MKKIIANLLLIISIIGVVFSGYQLYKIFNEYHNGTVEYNELEKEIKITETPNDTNTSNDIKLDIDFNHLLKINKNCIGWIYIPNTQINYPIVQSTDNNKCLHYTFNGKRNFTGCIFISDQNNGFEDKNTIIYGHNMQNGTMFTDINKYKNQEYLDTHPYVYIAKPNGKTEKYKIFATYKTQDCSEAYTIQFNSNEFIQKVNQMAKNSEVKINDFSISDDDKIITLSTCTSRTKLERFVLHAIKISEN